MMILSCLMAFMQPFYQRCWIVHSYSSEPIRLKAAVKSNNMKR